MLTILLIGPIMSALDRFGTAFEDDKLTILTKCQSSLETYHVPSSTTHIKSGTALENAFGAHCTLLNNITFSNDSELIEIGSYSFYKSKIIYLDLSNCIKLLRILDNAFQDCSSLTTLILSETLTHLGQKALQNINISFLKIPKDLLELPYMSISVCTKLTNVEFDPNCAITKILREAFIGSGLVEIRIPKSVTTLESAFMGCQLHRIQIDPENPMYVEENNVVYTKDFRSLILAAKYPGKIVVNPLTNTIKNNALRGCKPISLEMHENITLLETWSLSGMNLTEISLPKSVEEIGVDLFTISEYTRIGINCSIKSIPYGTFRSCKNLQRVDIPKGVSSIGSDAFYECISLQYLFIPGTVQTISSGAFSKMNISCEIVVEEGAGFIFIGRAQYTGDGKTLSNYFGENNVVFEIAYGATTVGENSVQSKSFSEVIFPNTTTTIGSSAFSNLKVYKPLNLENIESIGKFAFVGSNFSEIILGPNLKSISDYTFRGCPNLARINIPYSVESIGVESFRWCNSLSTVNFDFDSITGKNTMSLMSSSLSSIGQLAFNGISAKSIELPPYLVSIGYKAFAESSIQRVSFHSESVMRSLGEFSFADMKELTDFGFPKKCEVIGEACFSNDIKLTRIVLSDSIRNISTLAFSGCYNLKSVELGDNSLLENIEGLAFEGCSSLFEFVLSNNNHNFATSEGVLYNKELTRIVLYLPAYPSNVYVVPPSIVEIGPRAFYAAVHLENVSISDGCVKIGFEAFRGCSNLTHLRLPSTISDVASGVFADCPSLGCDSVIFPIGMDRNMLVDSKLPPAAYEHCPSSHFTIGVSSDSISVVFTAGMNCFSDDD